MAKLGTALNGLEKSLIADYLAAPPSLKISQRETIATTSFVVLAHAAFEEFFEDLSSWLLDRVVTNWTLSRRISLATACLLLAAKPNAGDSTKSIFDQIRLALDAQKVAMSKLIREDNHGVSEKHLRALLGPLGLDVVTNPTLAASLATLATERGGKAHKSIGATVHVAASDAKKLVDDCRKLAADAVSRAIAMRT